MLISLIMIIIAQCIHTSKHHVAYFTYIHLLFVNCTSIRWKKNGSVIFSSSRVTEWINLIFVKLISSSLQLVVVFHSFAEGPNVFLHDIVERKLEL